MNKSLEENKTIEENEDKGKALVPTNKKTNIVQVYEEEQDDDIFLFNETNNKKQYGQLVKFTSVMTKTQQKVIRVSDRVTKLEEKNVTLEQKIDKKMGKMEQKIKELIDRNQNNVNVNIQPQQNSSVLASKQLSNYDDGDRIDCCGLSNIICTPCWYITFCCGLRKKSAYKILNVLVGLFVLIVFCLFFYWFFFFDRNNFNKDVPFNATALRTEL